MDPMTMYLGVKQVLATRMTKEDFLKRNGRPCDVGDGSREGYLVRYPDGYESWCPEDVFEEANRRIDGMCFGHALEAAKKGSKIARWGWNGKDQFVVVMSALYLPPYNTQGTERKVNDRTAKWIGEDKPLDSQPYCALYNAQGKWQPGWVPSTGDLFADDWCIVE